MLEKIEAEVRGDDVMNALAGEGAKLPTANVAATARRSRDGMVGGGVGLWATMSAGPIDWLSARHLVPPLFLEISPFLSMIIAINKRDLPGGQFQWRNRETSLLRQGIMLLLLAHESHTDNKELNEWR